MCIRPGTGPIRLLAVSAALFAAAPAGAQVPTFNDVLFATVPRDDGGTEELRLDVYRPPESLGAGPFPAVVWIHGGGWQSGSQNNTPSFLGDLPGQGIVVISVSYRLSQEAIFPAQIHDVKGAIRFIRSQAAEYRVHPRRIGCWGSSAGGHLSALTATSGDVASLEGTTGGNLAYSSRVRAAVDYYGPTDILNIQLDAGGPPGAGHDAPTSPESRLIGWGQPGQGIVDVRNNLSNPNEPYPTLVARCQAVNPITFISADDPALLITHGSADPAVPIAQSSRLFDALSAAGLPVAFTTVPGGMHGGFPVGYQSAAKQFLIDALRAPLSPEGDLNCDGVVSVADVGPFVQAISEVPAYLAAHPRCDRLAADVNRDGIVSVGDIGAFVALLTN